MNKTQYQSQRYDLVDLRTIINDLSIFYVYFLSYKGQVFYVGKGRGDRVLDHEREARRGVKSYKCNKIRKVWSEGGEVDKTVVFVTSNETDAFIYEWCLINLVYGRENLTNLTDGGDGNWGRKDSPDVVERRAARLRGRHYQTPESIERIRERHLGSKHTDKQNKHMADKMSGREITWGDKISTAKKGIPPTPKVIELNVKRMSKTYPGFVSPDGVVYRNVVNLAAFCREHKLVQTNMSALSLGKYKQIKGWRRLEEGEWAV